MQKLWRCRVVDLKLPVKVWNSCKDRQADRMMDFQRGRNGKTKTTSEGYVKYLTVIYCQWHKIVL